MATVRFAANFQRNLEQLEAFEQQRESPAAFGTLLDELFDGIVPAIERFPQIGSDLLARTPGSAQGALLHERVSQLIPNGGTVRQYATSLHVILYLERRSDVVLLAIRHHRQLGFDFQSFWDKED